MKQPRWFASLLPVSSQKPYHSSSCPHCLGQQVVGESLPPVYNLMIIQCEGDISVIHWDFVVDICNHWITLGCYYKGEVADYIK